MLHEATLKNQGSTGVFCLLQFFSNCLVPRVLHRQADTESVSPRFLFIMAVIRVNRFVIGDSLTLRFMMRTEHLTKCCEPFQ